MYYINLYRFSNVYSFLMNLRTYLLANADIKKKSTTPIVRVYNAITCKQLSTVIRECAVHSFTVKNHKACDGLRVFTLKSYDNHIVFYNAAHSMCIHITWVVHCKKYLCGSCCCLCGKKIQHR